MGNIEHLPKRLAVVSWDAPRAVPAVVRADFHRGAVGAIEALALAKELAERHLLAYAHADEVVEQIDAALELLGGQ